MAQAAVTSGQDGVQAVDAILQSMRDIRDSRVGNGSEPKRSNPTVPRQAAIWRFDAFVAFGFVVLVFLIAAGSALEWWRLLRGSKRIVLHESEFVPLERAESTGV